MLSIRWVVCMLYTTCSVYLYHQLQHDQRSNFESVNTARLEMLKAAQNELSRCYHEYTPITEMSPFFHQKTLLQWQIVFLCSKINTIFGKSSLRQV